MVFAKRKRIWPEPQVGAFKRHSFDDQALNIPGQQPHNLPLPPKTKKRASDSLEPPRKKVTLWKAVNYSRGQGRIEPTKSSSSLSKGPLDRGLKRPNPSSSPSESQRARTRLSLRPGERKNYGLGIEDATSITSSDAEYRESSSEEESDDEPIEDDLSDQSSSDEEDDDASVDLISMRDKVIPLTICGDRPYSHWTGNFRGRLADIPGVGTLFPEGYSPRVGDPYPWICPIRDCQNVFPHSWALGGHFSAGHRGCLLNDNQDGSMSIVGSRKSAGADAGRIPPVVVSRSAIDPGQLPPKAPPQRPDRRKRAPKSESAKESAERNHNSKGGKIRIVKTPRGHETTAAHIPTPPLTVKSTKKLSSGNVVLAKPPSGDKDGSKMCAVETPMEHKIATTHIPTPRRSVTSTKQLSGSNAASGKPLPSDKPQPVESLWKYLLMYMPHDTPKPTRALLVELVPVARKRSLPYRWRYQLAGGYPDTKTVCVLLVYLGGREAETPCQVCASTERVAMRPQAPGMKTDTKDFPECITLPPTASERLKGFFGADRCCNVFYSAAGEKDDPVSNNEMTRPLPGPETVNGRDGASGTFAGSATFTSLVASGIYRYASSSSDSEGTGASTPPPGTPRSTNKGDEPDQQNPEVRAPKERSRKELLIGRSSDSGLSPCTSGISEPTGEQNDRPSQPLTPSEPLTPRRSGRPQKNGQEPQGKETHIPVSPESISKRRVSLILKKADLLQPKKPIPTLTPPSASNPNPRLSTPSEQASPPSIVSGVPSPSMVEQWEIAPGRITTGSGPSRQTIAFSSAYLSHAQPVPLAPDTTFRLVHVSPRTTQEWSTEADTLRICSVSQGVLVVTLDEHGLGEFRIGVNGMWTVRSGRTCTVKNPFRVAAVAHVSSVLVPREEYY